MSTSIRIKRYSILSLVANVIARTNMLIAFFDFPHWFLE